MTRRDDTERNYDIVLMIKKIALAIQRKDTHDLRAIAEELQTWEPRENWDDMDVRTKVFVEHVLLGFARLEFGLDILDKGANELREVWREMEQSDIHDGLDELNEEENVDRETGFVCFKCGQTKSGKAILEDSVGNKMCSRCASALDFIKEGQRKLDELAQEHTSWHADRFNRRNLDRVDRREKFTCEKCGLVKRKSAPGVSNYKEIDGHKICGRCYRAFKNWFEKTNRRLDEFWDKEDRKGTWDGGPIDERTKEAIGRLMRDYSLPDGQIDWKKFHRARREIEKKLRKERHNKERYRKDELSDEEKEGLK